MRAEGKKRTTHQRSKRLIFVAFALSLLIACCLVPQSSHQAQTKADAYISTIQPFLTANCTACHNTKSSAGGLNLEAFHSTADITANRERWEMIAQKIRSGEMPPQGMPKPNAAQVKSVLTALDALFAKLDRNAKPDPGRVTARRLNRAEYNNTVRDLLAVDFKPAEDFPADDSGYGFDNIGDVLSLSLLLLEKYLTAAEKIANKAIPINEPMQPVEERWRADRLYIESKTEREIIQVTHDFPVDGEYDLQADVAGSVLPNQQPPVKVTLWLDGQAIKTAEIDRKQPKPWIVTTRTLVRSGSHQFRATLSYDGEKPELKDKTKQPLGYNALQLKGPYNIVPPLVTESYRRVFTCGHDYGKHQPTCATRIISDLAKRAYRRPVKPEEVTKLLDFISLAQNEGDSFEQGVRVAVQAMLVSPHFLFRIERDPEPNNPRVQHRLSDYELASRLSYFLWSSTPDAELLRLAAQQRLHLPAVLNAQVRRMLRDAKAEALVENFAGQWLQLRNLDLLTPDPDRFPTFTPELRTAMKRETELFFATILKEDRSVLEFLDGKFTFLNEPLAKHYGIVGVNGKDFRRVTLDGTQRSGVLTQASILTISSYPTRTSPVIRGKWILENILNAPPPPPPPGVPLIDEAKVGLAASLRQQMEQHRTNPTCAACHAKMDPLGFGLENYDAIGAWRTKDGKFNVDATGTLPDGRTFQTPAELKAILKKDRAAFAEGLTEKMLTYALGRGLERYDKPVVKAISNRVAANQYRFSTLILGIVNSLPFQQRRGEVD